MSDQDIRRGLRARVCVWLILLGGVPLCLAIAHSASSVTTDSQAFVLALACFVLFCLIGWVSAKCYRVGYLERDQ